MSTQLKNDELKFWLAFSQITTIGPKSWQRVLHYFKNLEAAWRAPAFQLIQAGLRPKVAEQVIADRLKINPDRELEKVQKLKINMVTLLDPTYPRLLAETYCPPPLLYYFGELDLTNDFPLAIVGTRKMSSYGQQVTQNFASGLAAAGLTIISGLALGVDACAHAATLAAGGKTIAVLGSGIDQIYPAANRALAQKIVASGGAVISEFPLGMPPLKHNFPRRNRIISGLSLGVLVIEAGLKSGALITAKYAVEQNREVFAVPGNIYQAGSAGPSQLIKLGAKTTTEIFDVLDTLNLTQAKEFKAIKEIIGETENEKIILALLGSEPLHVDKLSAESKIDISVINACLSVMEMKGMIKNLGGQIYVKAQ